MSRYLTCFLVIGFLAAAAPAGVSFDWVEIATGIGPSNLYNCYDLNMTVDSNIALVEMYIVADVPAGNDFYQSGSPGTGYDTYVTCPVAYDDDIGAAIDIVETSPMRGWTFNTMFLDIAWAPLGGASSGSGTHKVARVTVKDGLDGSWQVYGLETGLEPLPEYSASGTSPLYNYVAALGDFNADTFLDALDIDLLTAAIAAASVDPKFDVDSSTVLDAADLTYWVETIKSTYYGDADLDGDVDNVDLTALALNWLGVSTPYGWAGANFNGHIDGLVNNVDLTAIALNWQYGVPPEPPAEPVSAPEPATIGLLVLGLAAVICKRKLSK